MELKDLIKAERELTGVTQEGFAKWMNEKYKDYQLPQLTQRMINIIESSGTISDSNLRNIFLNDFYFVNIENEKKIVSLAYRFADIITDIEKVGNSWPDSTPKEPDTSKEQKQIKIINVEELFSFTCRKELIQYIERKEEDIDNLEKSFNSKVNSPFLKLKQKKDTEFINKIRKEILEIKKEIFYSSDEVSIQFSSDHFTLNLNDTAKWIFYIAYYYLLLANKKGDKKDYIRKKDEQQVGFKEVFSLFYPTDNYDKVSEKVKGKIIAYINNRASLFISIFKSDAMSFFFDSFIGIKEIIPSDGEYEELLRVIERMELLQRVVGLFKDIDLSKNKNYESDSVYELFEYVSKLSIDPNLYSIKDFILQCYSCFHLQMLPSKYMIDYLIDRIKEKNYFESKELKNIVERINSDLQLKYENNKGNFTKSLFDDFFEKQRKLFLLYKKYNYMKLEGLLDAD